MGPGHQVEAMCIDQETSEFQSEIGQHEIEGLKQQCAELKGTVGNARGDVSQLDNKMPLQELTLHSQASAIPSSVVQCTQFKQEIEGLKQQCAELQGAFDEATRSASNLDKLVCQIHHKMQSQQKEILEKIANVESSQVEVGKVLKHIFGVPESNSSDPNSAFSRRTLQGTRNDLQGDSCIGDLSVLMDYKAVNAEEHHGAMLDLREEMSQLQEQIQASHSTQVKRVTARLEHRVQEVQKDCTLQIQEAKKHCNVRIQEAASGLQSLVDNGQAQMQQQIKDGIGNLQNQVVEAKNHCSSRIEEAVSGLESLVGNKQAQMQQQCAELQGACGKATCDVSRLDKLVIEIEHKMQSQEKTILEAKRYYSVRIQQAESGLQSLMDNNQAQMQQNIKDCIGNLQNQVVEAKDHCSVRLEEAVSGLQCRVGMVKAANDQCQVELDNCLSRASEAERRIKEESEGNMKYVSKICDETKKIVDKSFEKHRVQIDTQVKLVTQSCQQLDDEQKELKQWCKVTLYNTFDDQYLVMLGKVKDMEKVVQAIPGLNLGDLLDSSGEHCSGPDVQTREWVQEHVQQAEQNCMEKAKKEMDTAKKELESLGIQLRSIQQELIRVEQSTAHAAQANNSADQNDPELKHKIEEANEGVRTCTRRLNTMEKTVSDVKHDFEKLKGKLKPKSMSLQDLPVFSSVSQPRTEDARQRIRGIETEIMQCFADSTKTAEDRTKFVKEMNKLTHPDKPGGSHEVQLWFQEWQDKFKSWFIEGRKR